MFCLTSRERGGDVGLDGALYALEKMDVADGAGGALVIPSMREPWTAIGESCSCYSMRWPIASDHFMTRNCPCTASGGRRTHLSGARQIVDLVELL